MVYRGIEVISVKKAASMKGVSDAAIRERLYESSPGKIQGFKIKGRWYVILFTLAYYEPRNYPRNGT